MASGGSPIKSAYEETETASADDDCDKTEEKSLCWAAFGINIRTSEEDMNQLVKEVIKEAVCQRALALRDEIKREMNLEDTQKELEKQLEHLKISRGILMTIQKDIERLSINPKANEEILQKCFKTRETTMNCVRKSLEKVNGIERRMATLKACWDHFRENFKDEILKAVTQLNTEQKDAVQPVVKWTSFLPDVGTLSLNSENLDTVL